ncbi:hypothetical protein J2T20_004708 [Paenibacillus wynnii]|nr:hypothetical protein [Paenibacillus wynnii]
MEQILMKLGLDTTILNRILEIILQGKLLAMKLDMHWG